MSTVPPAARLQARTNARKPKRPPVAWRLIDTLELAEDVAALATLLDAYVREEQDGTRSIAGAVARSVRRNAREITRVIEELLDGR
jgi:hypothetical protein